MSAQYARKAGRTKNDALEIEAGAKRRLADEYDAAQERGEVATRQNNPGSQGHVPKQNMPATAADIGLSRKEIHEAHIIRDAETTVRGIDHWSGSCGRNKRAIIG